MSICCSTGAPQSLAEVGANLAVVHTVSVLLSDFPAAGPCAGQSICRLGPVGCRGEQGAPAEDAVLGELPVPGFSVWAPVGSRQSSVLPHRGVGVQQLREKLRG